MSVAAPIVLRPGDESKLRAVLRCSTAGAGVAQRARIVLLAAEGASNAEIGRRVGVSRPTVLSWRGRYEQSGIAGLGDLDRSGRPPVIDDLAVVVATLEAPPASLGVMVGSVAGQTPGDFLRLGRPYLAGARSEAVEAGDVQVLHRP